MAINDYLRVAYNSIRDSGTADNAVEHLLVDVRYYRSLGVTIRRALADNGAYYRRKKFAAMCRCLGIQHRFSLFHTRCANGKVERFIRTVLREWDCPLA